MRVVVLGDEAVDNLIGGLLAITGQSVFIISGDDAHIGAIAHQGLWLDGVTGRVNAELRAGRQLTERPDVLLLNMSMDGVIPALATYRRLLKDVPTVTL